MELKVTDRKTVSDKLSTYDIYINEDDSNNFIEVTEWSNGEGIDVTIGDKKNLSLSWGELDAINYLNNTLRFHS